MKISNKLSQFNGARAILLVTGRYGGEVYEAKDGVIDKVHSFKVEKPRYTDKEGFMRVRSRGKVIRCGAAYEISKDEIRDKFARRFREAMRAIKNPKTVTHIYLYVPAYRVNLVQNALPAQLKRRLARILRGNFEKEHPFRLLERLKPYSRRVS